MSGSVTIPTTPENTASVAAYLIATKTIYPDQVAGLFNNTYSTNPQPDGSYNFDLANDYEGSVYYTNDSGTPPTDPTYLVSYQFAASDIAGAPSNYVTFTSSFGNGATFKNEAAVVGVSGDNILLQAVNPDGTLVPNAFSLVSLTPLTALDNKYNNGSMPATLPLDFSSTGNWTTPADVVGAMNGLIIPTLPKSGGNNYAYATFPGADIYEQFPGVGIGGAYPSYYVLDVTWLARTALPTTTIGYDLFTTGLTQAQINAGQIYQENLYKNNTHSAQVLDTVLGWQGSGASTAILLGQGPGTLQADGTTTYGAYSLFFSSLLVNPTTGVNYNPPLPFTRDVGDTGLITAPCFASGTHIRTIRGAVAVEDLSVGDEVITLQDGAGVSRPVVWIGSRRVDVAAHPAPHTVRPIRILRGAFGDALPGADLVVSPDHALFVDGKLIAARLLINGATVVEEAACRAVQYFHVELDQHAVLFAEDLPAESYLDTGNRAAFENAGRPVILHPDFSLERRLLDRAAASCAPFAVDEAAVKPVWTRLAARAKALGFAVPAVDTGSDTPTLNVSVMGRTVQRVRVAQDRYAFVLPAGAKRVTLASRTTRPSATAPWLDDRRELGVSVRRITLRGSDGTVRDIAIDHPGLTEGWWSVERTATQTWRWTNGQAVLELAEGAEQGCILEITFVGGIAHPVALAA